MSRKLLKTTSAASELYPVVQDLTKIEYGTGICCGAMLGSFSLAELALPNIHARALSSPDSAFDPSKNKQHRRALSLLQLSSSVAGNTVLNHKRCSSSPMTVGSCGTFETSHTQSVDGDRIDGYPEMHLFNDAFVLTRQVR